MIQRQPPQHRRGRARRRRRARQGRRARHRLGGRRVRRRRLADRRQAARQRQADQRRDRDQQGVHGGLPPATDAHLHQRPARAGGVRHHEHARRAVRDLRRRLADRGRRRGRRRRSACRGGHTKRGHRLLQGRRRRRCSSTSASRSTSRSGTTGSRRRRPPTDAGEPSRAWHRHDQVQQPDRRRAGCRPPTAPRSSARNPADRADVVSIAPEATAADVAAAVDAAVDAAGVVAPHDADRARRAPDRGGPPARRARRRRSPPRWWREEGKPLADARNEASRTPQNLELYAGEAYRLTGATFPSDDTPLVYSMLDPVGVVGVITPWNFPLNLASRKIGPALAAGNTVVFKPSPMTPLMGERLAAAFIDAGLPPGRAQRRARLRRRRAPRGRRARRRRHVHRVERHRSARSMPRSGSAGACSSSSAARTRSSCSPTPTSTPRPPSSRAVELHASAGRRAPAPAGSSSTEAVHDELVDRVVALAAALRDRPGRRARRDAWAH